MGKEQGIERGNNGRGREHTVSDSIDTGVPAGSGIAGSGAIDAFRTRISSLPGQAGALDEVRSFASDQPVVALLSAMTLGVIIGFLLARR